MWRTVLVSTERCGGAHCLIDELNCWFGSGARSFLIVIITHSYIYIYTHTSMGCIQLMRQLSGSILFRLRIVRWSTDLQRHILMKLNFIFKFTKAVRKSKLIHYIFFFSVLFNLFILNCVQTFTHFFKVTLLHILLYTLFQSHTFL